MAPTRTIPAIRLMLACAVLGICLFEPGYAGRMGKEVSIVALLFVLSSMTFYALTLFHSPVVGFISRWEHWSDFGWFTLLIAFETEPATVLNFGLLFPVLVASFRSGFFAGLRVTILSSLVSAGFGIAYRLPGAESLLYVSLVRPSLLAVLGYMINYWGGFEIRLHRRLRLISEVTHISNPRFGIDQTLASFMARLGTFYDAESSLLIMPDPDGSEFTLRRWERSNPERALRAEPIPPEMSSVFLALPSSAGVIFRNVSGRWHARAPYVEHEFTRGACSSEGRKATESLAATLEAASILSVPFLHRNQRTARLFIVGRRAAAFEDTDILFVAQVIEQVAPVIDNIRLIDRLATEAASTERQKIARDLHDSVIQPYIGLRLGIDGLRRKMSSGRLAIEDLDRLLKVSEAEIETLRGYVSGLKARPGLENDLAGAIRRFAAKFADATGIATETDLPEKIPISDRLAAEIFQIVAEGLSNIRRHTVASHAQLRLKCSDGNLVVAIRNNGDRGLEPCRFVPRSITERASSLGGESRVEAVEGGGSRVIVNIPM